MSRSATCAKWQGYWWRWRHADDSCILWWSCISIRKKAAALRCRAGKDLAATSQLPKLLREVEMLMPELTTLPMASSAVRGKTAHWPTLQLWFQPAAAATTGPWLAGGSSQPRRRAICKTTPARGRTCRLRFRVLTKVFLRFLAAGARAGEACGRLPGCPTSHAMIAPFSEW